MSEQETQQIWLQQNGEPSLWFGRFERYRLMWPHSIPEVYRDEWRIARLKSKQQGEGKQGENRGIDTTLEQELPKKAPNNWYEMAAQWTWEKRVAAWDAHQIKVIEEKVVAEKTRTLLTGYALQYRRIAQLNDQAELLIAMIKDPNKVWVPDVKAVGTGEFAERVDLVQFNAPLFHEVRATFDDIAKELGERIRKSEVKIKELPKEYINTPDDDGVEEE